MLRARAKVGYTNIIISFFYYFFLSFLNLKKLDFLPSYTDIGHEPFQIQVFGQFGI
jgi:hypothetical protein